MAHVPAPSAVPAGDFRDVLLRYPSLRPQKGRQAVRDVVGEESWAGHDDDFSRALAFTPAAFTWVRAKTHLVELPALWAKVPTRGRDELELAAAITSALTDEGCPAPHFLFEGEGHLFVIWAIEPLRRPKALNPTLSDEERQRREVHHGAYQGRLEDWRKAAIKLSFVLEPLGARPLDVALADELLCGFVPLPLREGSALHEVISLHDEPPRQLDSTYKAPIRIADVSRPLARLDARSLDPCRCWARAGLASSCT